MSIEFAARLEPALQEDRLRRLKAHIMAQVPFKLIRDQDGQFGLTSDDGGTEVITVMLHPERVYVAFHSVSRSGREAFLKVVEEGLSLEGISEAQFKEL